MGVLIVHTTELMRTKRTDCRRLASIKRGSCGAKSGMCRGLGCGWEGSGMRRSLSDRTREMRRLKLANNRRAATLLLAGNLVAGCLVTLEAHATAVKILFIRVYYNYYL